MISHEHDQEEHQGERVPGRKGFPGGTAKLPRLVGPSAEEHVIPSSPAGPQVMIVEGGFAADAPGTPTAPGRHVRRLLAPGVAVLRPRGGGDGRDTGPHAPCRTGRGPEASWREIKAAHRRLLAQLHPDRFVTATERQQREAADRLAEVNLAYHQLSKERTAS